jgi:hypothetical protein
VKIGTAGILNFTPIHQTTDRTMAQRVGRQALTAEGQVRSQTTSGAIRGGRSDNLTGFHLSTSDILCQYDSTITAHSMSSVYRTLYNLRN